MAAPELAATDLDAAMDAVAYVTGEGWPRPDRGSAVATVLPTMRQRNAVDQQRVFSVLADEWRRETAHLSSITDIALHPAYQQIIGMGEAALPMILAELASELGHWFWALYAITGENPVTEEDAGDLPRMRDAWMRLARARGWFA